MERKRSRMNIISDILEVILKKKGKIKPTHLMYRANLSHRQMKLYLDEMLAKDLVEKSDEDERKMIVITNKGRKFFSGYNQLREFENTFGI
jgi:predicted transcriptional regulator